MTIDRAPGGVKDNVRDELAESQESLEAQGRALWRKGELKTYAVLPRADGGWTVQAEGADRPSRSHSPKWLRRCKGLTVNQFDYHIWCRCWATHARGWDAYIPALCLDLLRAVTRL